MQVEFLLGESVGVWQGGEHRPSRVNSREIVAMVYGEYQDRYRFALCVWREAESSQSS